VLAELEAADETGDDWPAEEAVEDCDDWPVEPPTACVCGDCPAAGLTAWALAVCASPKLQAVRKITVCNQEKRDGKRQ